MRKVLSFVLVLSLVLGSFGMAFAAPMSDVAGKDFEDAVNVLTELGVVKGYPDGTFKPDNIVTRAEMAVIVVSALGLSNYATGTANFSDMGGHWSNPFVAYATSLGVIAGYPDGTFKPDKTVSYDEAATMLVAALGYNTDSLVGTWPANFVTKAKTLGILDGIKAGVTGANRGDIATMTYQTLDQGIGKTNKDGDFVANVPADNMLTRLDAQEYDPGNDSYDQNPVVAATSTVGEAFVVTGDEDSIISLKNLQGALVTAYANSDNEIIAIKEVKSTFYTGEFDDIATAGLITGTDEFGDYEVKASAIPAAVTGVTGDKLTVAFVNGDVAGAGANEVATAVVADGNDYTIACDISGNYITKIYSIATWTVSGADMIDDNDLDDIADGELLTFEFELDDNDDVDYDTFALYGVKSLGEIEEDDVVYVYDNGTNIKRVDVGKEVVEGEITKINSTATEITVGGKAYELSGAPGADPNAQWPTVLGAGVKVENEVKLYLDYAGDVFDLEKTSASADQVAVILDTADEVAGLTGNPAMIKLLLQDGTTKTFDAVEDDIDDSFLAVVATLDTWTVAGNPYDAGNGNVVKYNVNEDGEVDALEPIDGTYGAGGLNVDPAATVTGDVSKTGYFDGYKIASDAIVIVVDDITTFSDDADDYEFVTRDAILGNSITAQYVLENGLITAIVVDAASTSDDEIYGVFAGKARVSGGTTYEVTMLIDGKEVVYAATAAGYAAVDATLTGIEAEDQLLLLEFNAAGEVKNAVAAFDGTSPADTGFATTDADVNVVALTAAAKTITIKNNVATVTAGTIGAQTHDWGTWAIGNSITIDSGATIYKVNDDGDWVKASINDLKMTLGTKTVAFFDVFDDDKIADYVLIK